MSSSIIILVTSLLLLYIFHQYNQQFQPNKPIQAIDQGLHHTELVYNNYTGSNPVQVENYSYCQPIKAIDQGLYHTEIVYHNYTGGCYLVQVKNDPYCQPNQTIDQE